MVQFFILTLIYALFACLRHMGTAPDPQAVQLLWIPLKDAQKLAHGCPAECLRGPGSAIFPARLSSSPYIELRQNGHIALRRATKIAVPPRKEPCLTNQSIRNMALRY